MPFLRALTFLKTALQAIIKDVDQICWEEFFKRISQGLIMELFVAVFDQYHLWWTMQFRKHESLTVDFCAIFARNTPDCKKWQQFFRHMFINMIDQTYIHWIKEKAPRLPDVLKSACDKFPGSQRFEISILVINMIFLPDLKYLIAHEDMS